MKSSVLRKKGELDSPACDAPKDKPALQVVKGRKNFGKIDGVFVNKDRNYENLPRVHISSEISLYTPEHARLLLQSSLASHNLAMSDSDARALAGYLTDKGLVHKDALSRELSLIVYEGPGYSKRIGNSVVNAYSVNLVMDMRYEPSLEDMAFVPILRRYRKFSNAENRYHLMRYRDGDPGQKKESMDLLILHNMRLIAQIAKRYAKKNLPPIEDLINEGVKGFMNGIQRFDLKTGNQMSTYVSWWVKQAITRYIQDTGRTIRVPVHAQEIYAKVQSALSRGSYNVGSPSDIRRLAQDAGVSVTHAVMALEVPSTTSLNRPIGDGTSELSDVVARDYSDKMNESSRARDIERVLKTLPPVEAEIIRYRFGLAFPEGYLKEKGGTADIRHSGGLTLDEIGKYKGVTRERIRQIEAKALNRLRHPSRSRLLEDYAKDDPMK